MVKKPNETPLEFLREEYDKEIQPFIALAKAIQFAQVRHGNIHIGFEQNVNRFIRRIITTAGLYWGKLEVREARGALVLPCTVDEVAKHVAGVNDNKKKVTA